MFHRPRGRAIRAAALILTLPLLGGCATLGSVMSPYSEKFSCKNDDHGQCIHPEKAYEDAALGHASHSDPPVTRDKALLKTNSRGAVGRGVSLVRACGVSDNRTVFAHRSVIFNFPDDRPVFTDCSVARHTSNDRSVFADIPV